MTEPKQIPKIQKLTPFYCPDCKTKIPRDVLENKNESNSVCCPLCGVIILIDPVIESHEPTQEKPEQQAQLEKPQPPLKKNAKWHLKLHLYFSIQELLYGKLIVSSRVKKQKELGTLTIKRYAKQLRSKLLKSPISRDLRARLSPREQKKLKKLLLQFKDTLKDEKQFKKHQIQAFMEGIEFIFDVMKGNYEFVDLSPTEKELIMELKEKISPFKDMRHKKSGSRAIIIILARFIHQRLFALSRTNDILSPDTVKDLVDGIIDQLREDNSVEWIENNININLIKRDRYNLKLTRIRLNFDWIQRESVSDLLVSTLDTVRALMQDFTGEVPMNGLSKIIMQAFEESVLFRLDKVFSTNEKLNLTIVFARLIHAQISVAFPSPKLLNTTQKLPGALQRDITNTILEGLLDNLEIKPQFLLRFYNFSLDKFHAAREKLFEKLDGDMMYRASFKTFLANLIKTVFKLTRLEPKGSKLTPLELRIREDLEVYPYDWRNVNVKLFRNPESKNKKFTHFSKELRNEIALYIKSNYYDNKFFWDEKQKSSGLLKKWTDRQSLIIFNEILDKFYQSKYEDELGKQTKERIIELVIVVPLILDSSPDRLSKKELSVISGINYNSTMITELVKILIPEDYETRFSYSGDRNPSKRKDVREKIAVAQRNKVKIKDLRNFISIIVFGKLMIDINLIIRKIDLMELIRESFEIKITKYIEEQIHKSILATQYIIRPTKPGLPLMSQQQIQHKSGLHSSEIREISKNIEKRFKFYNHSKRFNKNWNRNKGTRKNSEGNFIHEFQIRNAVCNYIFSELKMDWGMEMTLRNIKSNINNNKYLKLLEGLNISKYLENQFEKYIVAVRLIIEPFFISKKNDYKFVSIEEIKKTSGLDNRQIRAISENFEKTFGIGIFNNLQRFPIPQHNTGKSFIHQGRKFDFKYDKDSLNSIDNQEIKNALRQYFNYLMDYANIDDIFNIYSEIGASELYLKGTSRPFREELYLKPLKTKSNMINLSNDLIPKIKTLKSYDNNHQLSLLTNNIVKEFHHKNNRLPDHSIIERYLLNNLDDIIALEIPVWKQLKKSNRNLSGHIDLVAVKENVITVLDYKPSRPPENSMYRSLPQVAAYGLMLKERIGDYIDQKKFVIKCISFNKNKVIEFEPMILVREIKEFVKKANSERKNRLRTKNSKKDLLEMLELIQD